MFKMLSVTAQKIVACVCCDIAPRRNLFAMDTYQTQEYLLPAGATQTLRVVSGTMLVCLEGGLHRSERVVQADGILPYIVQVPLYRGESYACEEATWITLTASVPARLLCLYPKPLWRVWVGRGMQRVAKYAMIHFIRRGVEQSGSSSGS